VTKKFNFKLFGDRVLLERVAPKRGSIHIPQMAESVSTIGRVIALGNGKRPGIKTIQHNGHFYEVTLKDVEMLVEIGDIVYFETNVMSAANAAYDMGDDMLVNLSHGDIIAKISGSHLDGVEITVDNFEIMPDFIMVDPFQRELSSTIALPEVAQKAQRVYYRLLKKGSNVKKPCEIGDELLLDQSYSRPLDIQGKTYGYVHQNAIHGVVEESRIIA
jgi:co-chaperonin GroES (HSP10)